MAKTKIKIDPDNVRVHDERNQEAIGQSLQNPGADTGDLTGKRPRLRRKGKKGKGCWSVGTGAGEHCEHTRNITPPMPRWKTNAETCWPCRTWSSSLPRIRTNMQKSPLISCAGICMIWSKSSRKASSKNWLITHGNYKKARKRAMYRVNLFPIQTFSLRKPVFGLQTAADRDILHFIWEIIDLQPESGYGVIKWPLLEYS